MGKLFSGSKSQTQTNGEAGYIKDSFGGQVGQGAKASLNLSQLLGGDSTGFDAYKKATGFDATAELGSRGITGNAAAGGLLRSGSTGTALQNYGQTLQNQYAKDYMAGNQQQTENGLNAGGLIAKTAKSKTKDKSKPGLGAILGGGLSSFAGGV